MTDALPSFYYRLARPRGKPQMRQDIAFNVAKERETELRNNMRRGTEGFAIVSRREVWDPKRVAMQVALCVPKHRSRSS